MAYETNKFEMLLSLMKEYAAEEGANYSPLEGFGTYKSSKIQSRKPALDMPAIWLIGQGKKVVYAGEQQYDYSAGNAVVMFYPMAVETEVFEASPEIPLLVSGVYLDLGRMAEVLMKIDRIDGPAPKPVSINSSSIFSIPLNDYLLNPFIRLYQIIKDRRDAAVLGDSIIDEIYYRLLTGERDGELRFLLQQRGEIQRISKAVEHIHSNINQPISVEELADMVHMSRTSFYETFKDVMHVSPLQYAKSVKLHRAQSLIMDGRNASEAGYMVGYNSPAQFSREYKRHFGFSPSAT